MVATRGEKSTAASVAAIEISAASGVEEITPVPPAFVATPSMLTLAAVGLAVPVPVLTN